MVDRLGNVSARRITVRVDEKGPIVLFTAPATGATVRGTVTTTLVARDPSGVAKVELFVDGRSAGVDTAAPYQMKVPVGTRRGPRTFVWKVTDGLGNVTTTTRVVTAAN